MLVKVPKEIQVGCHKYKICFSEAQEEDGHNATTNNYSRTIRINPHLKGRGSYLDVVFLHELVHAIGRIYPDVDIPEDDVEGLSQGLGQVFFSGLGIELDWSGIPTMKEVE